jgi:Putative Ig domain
MHISRECALPAGAFTIFTALLAASGTLFSSRADAQNRPPTISGSPPTTVVVDSLYSFRPTARDPDTPLESLRFSIANKPAWASFSRSNGRLYGRPQQIGSWGNIRIRVTDGRSTASLAPFSIRATATSGNQPPTISGSPPALVTPGTAYAFTPTARDPNGDPLTFSIVNRPAWANFSTGNGRLSGTPTASQVGAYSSIRISVSDGRASAALPAFGITVSDVANGSATLSWTPPTRNTNGSQLTNLAGYRIYYGTSAGALSRSVQIANPGLARYVINNLAPATWYFAVRAYNSAGVESAQSNMASKTVR